MAVNSALHGYEKDDVNIKEAVYRVKNNDNTDKYSRIHFETNSKMIYDATHLATGNKVARRDANGDIWFSAITASGKVTTGSIENNGTSVLKGATTIGENVGSNNIALTVGSGKNTLLGGTLSVSGVSTFTGLTTHTAGATLGNKLTVSSGGAAISGATTISGSLTASSLTITGNSTLGGVNSITTINGTAAINKLTVTDTGVVSGLNADRVDNCHVNDAAVSTTNLWTASKIDSAKANKTTTISAGGGLTGGGDLSANRTIAHSTRVPSKTVDNNGTSAIAIKSITFDAYGHPTAYVENNLDARYPTKSQVSQDIANAQLTVSRDLISKNPTDRADNGNNLIMQNFTMQYNSNTNSIDFIFV